MSNLAPDAGHGPRYGCTYRLCGNPGSPEPCPFTRDNFDTPLQDRLRKIAPTQCQHDWRQLITGNSNYYTFYCTRRLCTKTATRAIMEGHQNSDA